MRPAPCAESSASARRKVRKSGDATVSAKPPIMHIDATRSPGARSLPAGALRTAPATSEPGMNGSSGLSWYRPRLCSTSGNETPAASTSTITTPPSGRQRVHRLGLRHLDQLQRAGPVSSLIWTARIAASYTPARRAAGDRPAVRLGRPVVDAERPHLAA